MVMAKEIIKDLPVTEKLPKAPVMTVDIQSGNITLDRRREMTGDPILNGSRDLFPWTSLRNNGNSWELIGPGNRNS